MTIAGKRKQKSAMTHRRRLFVMPEWAQRFAAGLHLDGRNGTGNIP